jgi:glycosyltransferase involved in cell wall biosynthesis
MLKALKRKKELRLSDSYQMLGTVSGESKEELLRKAIFFVLPSYNEGLPIAILEALAAGLAVVATKVGGIPEVVQDGYNGFLLAPGDIAAITEKLALLTHNHDLRYLMGKRSRELAEIELDVIPYVERLISLYESVSFA